MNDTGQPGPVPHNHTAEDTNAKSESSLGALNDPKTMQDLRLQNYTLAPRYTAL